MADNVPKQIGKYPISRELGRGATSRVYLAHDPFGDRDVAIKVVRAEPGVDPAVQKRFNKSFLNEAALIGRLIHPHIVQIFDANVTDDYSYIVMEFAPGETLESRCVVSNLLPISDVVEIAFKCRPTTGWLVARSVISPVHGTNVYGATTMVSISVA